MCSAESVRAGALLGNPCPEEVLEVLPTGTLGITSPSTRQYDNSRYRQIRFLIPYFPPTNVGATKPSCQLVCEAPFKVRGIQYYAKRTNRPKIIIAMYLFFVKSTAKDYCKAMPHLQPGLAVTQSDCGTCLDRQITRRRLAALGAATPPASIVTEWQSGNW